MSATHRLVNRKGVYYYRRRVPNELVERMGMEVISLSLGTKSLKEAQKQRELKDIEWSARFEQLAAMPSTVNGSQSGKKPITGQEAQKLIRAYVEKSVRTFARRYEDDPPKDDAERQEMAKQIDIDATMLTRVGDPQHDELLAVNLDRVLGDYSVDPSI
jgi:hypothetical protein